MSDRKHFNVAMHTDIVQNSIPPCENLSYIFDVNFRNFSSYLGKAKQQLRFLEYFVNPSLRIRLGL